MISCERARELLAYDPATGLLRWKPRADDGTASYGNFKQYEGKVAGYRRKGSPYIITTIDKQHCYAHRVVWLIVTGGWPDGVIDHIDGDPSNNTLANLRVVSDDENKKNAGIGRRNKSGVLGVFFAKHVGRWTAQIRVGGRARALGYFDTIEEAAEARSRASELHGFHPNHGRRLGSAKAYAEERGETA